jgi:hypothetical protein
MADRAEREPSMEEIVVALRDTRRGAGRAPPFTVVGEQRGERNAAGSATDAAAVSTDIADLRDGEIQRLLAENARLNERVVFLLKVIEREQARNAEYAATNTDRGAISHEVRAALEAELQPVLRVLLRLLEQQRGRAPASPATLHNDDGIIDLDAPRT